MTISRVVIAHTAVSDSIDPSTIDVLEQVDFLVGGLDALAIPHRVVGVPCGRAWEALADVGDAVVCNLLEAPPGKPQFHAAATAVLELLGVPFTGASYGSMWLTTDKIATRSLLVAEGLPVAPGGRFYLDDPAVLSAVPPPWIIKPGWEDASVGLDGDPVCDTRDQALARGRSLAVRFPDQPILVEHFLPGRELNVSLLAREDDVDILPVAEMMYVDFPPGMRQVLGFEAKWSEDTFAYDHTVRRFPDSECDRPMLARARELARAAWRITGVQGYARVDMRGDENGELCILEVNANPCLSATAGLAAAGRQAGLTSAEIVRRLLDAAVRRHHQGELP